MQLAVWLPSWAGLCRDAAPTTNMTGIRCIITVVMCSAQWHLLQGYPDQC